MATKKIMKYDFPHPVLALGRDDYKDNCDFHSGEIKEDDIKADDKNIVIAIEYFLECKGLQNMITNGDAVAVVSVRSNTTSYSELFKFEAGKTKMDISVPTTSVKTTINIACSIIAARDIDDFCCEGEFNELYFKGETFDVRQGDILAVEAEKSINIGDSRPLSSIFVIENADTQEDDISVKWEENEIVIISLKQELYDIYCKFKDMYSGEYRKFLACIIVYPVLVEAIELIKEDLRRTEDDDRPWADKSWAVTIQERARELNVDLQDVNYGTSAEIASRMISNVVSDTLKKFEMMQDNLLERED